MNAAEARDLHARITFRSQNHPTKVGAALRAVIAEHAPLDESDLVLCGSHVVPYPCDDVEIIARELGVPLPGDRPAAPTAGQVLAALPLPVRGAITTRRSVTRRA